jgi:hypothetical protein
MDQTIPVNVMLSVECLEGLEELTAAIRRGTGAMFTRSKLIRAIVAGVVGSRMDFSRCRTEVELAGLLAFLLDALRRHAADAPAAAPPQSTVMPTSGLRRSPSETRR